MNNFRFSFLALVFSAVIVFFTACGSEKSKDRLQVFPDDLEFYADDPDELFVDVESNVKTWSTATSARWITIDEIAGGFYVSVDKYTETSRDRTGRIIVKAGEADPVTVTVTQLAAVNTTLSLNPTSLTYAANETGTKTVTVTTNTSDWDAEKSADWLTIQKMGTTLMVNVNSLNTGSLQRSTGVTVTAGNANPVTLTVTQEVTGGSVTLSVNPTSVSFAAAETVTKNATITTGASSWNFTNSDNSWLTVARQGVTNTINITPNSQNTGTSQRSSTITITASGADPVTVSVTQDGSGGSSSYPPSGTYVATKGGASIFDETPNTWNGILRSSDLTGGNFCTIRDFLGDEDLFIFGDFKDSKIFLDDYTNLWEGTIEGVEYQERLGFMVRYNGSNYRVTPNNPVEIKYNSATRVLDFSNKMNVNFGGTIGTVNDLTVYVGVALFPKSGTGTNYWYDAAPDIKLTITPGSLAPPSSSSNSGLMSGSQSMPQKKAASNRVKTIDVSKLTPIDGVVHKVE